MKQGDYPKQIGNPNHVIPGSNSTSGIWMVFFIDFYFLEFDLVFVNVLLQVL